ncbi:unnamed protein product [Caenorhabditis angaria]|uniref:Uncharacterized protein n=1 Tax=Caenorhabditis angaria TaxID=860376 RepID=A0A9P1IY95_9PELO|nr:unnamed protein product [Caenorhabditis angaria]
MKSFILVVLLSIFIVSISAACPKCPENQHCINSACVAKIPCGLGCAVNQFCLHGFCTYNEPLRARRIDGISNFY